MLEMERFADFLEEKLFTSLIRWRRWHVIFSVQGSLCRFPRERSQTIFTITLLYFMSKEKNCSVAETQTTHKRKNIQLSALLIEVTETGYC